MSALAVKLMPDGELDVLLEQAKSLTGVTASAVFDRSRTYRYLLTRMWDPMRPPAVFLMLNPSTADSFADDPTIRRCTAFALRENAGGLVVVNLFALRSTDPALLRDHPDPVGKHNDAFIRHAVQGPGPVIAAWGAAGALHDRATAVSGRLWDAGIPMQCLGVTSTGQPRHPLYLPKVAALVPYAAVQS